MFQFQQVDTPPYPTAEGAPDVCPGCPHYLSRHYHDVRGVARCLVTESGTSTSGMTGLPWTSECDCTNYVSERALAAEWRRGEEEKVMRMTVEEFLQRDFKKD